jgi:nitronate monooxygenase
MGDDGGMTAPLRTAFTTALGIEHPIALAPMGNCAGGALAAAVSDGGGLGLIGGARGDWDWLARELDIVTGRTTRPWGVGFLAWSADPAIVRRTLEYRPHAVMLSFGNPAALAGPVTDAGVPLIVQVTDLDEARQALDAGADVLVAQGSEAGGHGGARSTLPFVPAVADLAGPVPVLAAGGIADGRGLAAALALGAAGALIGTRFQATQESLAAPDMVKALLDGTGEDTERGRAIDIARGAPWPPRYPGRALRNDFTRRWAGREDELAADEAAQAEFREAFARGDLRYAPVWAGEGTDLITDVPSAADLTGRLAADARAALVRAAGG